MRPTALVQGGGAGTRKFLVDRVDEARCQSHGQMEPEPWEVSWVRRVLSTRQLGLSPEGPGRALLCSCMVGVMAHKVGRALLEAYIYPEQR